MEVHRQRRVKDKGALMTMIFKKAAPIHPSRSFEDNTVIAIHPETGQLLHYENVCVIHFIKY